MTLFNFIDEVSDGNGNLVSVGQRQIIILKKCVRKNQNYCTGNYRKRERSVLMNIAEDRDSQVIRVTEPIQHGGNCDRVHYWWMRL